VTSCGLYQVIGWASLVWKVTILRGRNREMEPVSVHFASSAIAPATPSEEVASWHICMGY